MGRTDTPRRVKIMKTQIPPRCLWLRIIASPILLLNTQKPLFYIISLYTIVTLRMQGGGRLLSFDAFVDGMGKANGNKAMHEKEGETGQRQPGTLKGYVAQPCPLTS